MQEIGELQGIKPVCNREVRRQRHRHDLAAQQVKAAGVDTIVVWAQGTPIGAADAQHGEDQLLSR